MFCEVYLFDAPYHIDFAFDYSCADTVRVGDIVKVPFGRGDRLRYGVVTALKNEAEETAMKDYYFYKNEPIDKFEFKRKSLIRVCECSSVYDLLLFGSESGDVFIYELLSNIN